MKVKDWLAQVQEQADEAAADNVRQTTDQAPVDWDPELPFR